MGIPVAVASKAIERFAGGRGMLTGDTRKRVTDFGHGSRPGFRRCGRGSGERLLPSDPGKNGVVHLRWADRGSPMLHVAAPTVLDRRVESGRLLREHGSIGVVAGEAGCRLNSPIWSVAGLALRAEERM